MSKAVARGCRMHFLGTRPSMPPDLPGYYFDLQRNRYFPLSSRPPAPQIAVAGSPLTPPRSKKRILWDSRLSSSTSFAARSRVSNSLLHARLEQTSQSESWPVPPGSAISAFTTTPWSSDQGVRQFIGDTQGCIYARNYDTDWADWTLELCLARGSYISALLATPAHAVSVCFGPTTKIAIQNSGAPDRTTLLTLLAISDVRAASIQRGALALAAAFRAYLIPDLESHSSLRTLATASDVFAIAQQETLVYTGTRSGTVLRFDTRTKTELPAHAQRICDSRIGWGASSSNPPRSSASFVHPLSDGSPALVVGFMDGRLALYDLRFVRPSAPPAVVYADLVPGPAPPPPPLRLGITLDPAERFLFNALPDGRLQGWAVSSGRALHPPPLPHVVRPGLLATRFASPPTALQVLEEGAGMVLWAAHSGEVSRWTLCV